MNDRRTKGRSEGRKEVGIITQTHLTSSKAHFPFIESQKITRYINGDHHNIWTGERVKCRPVHSPWIKINCI